MTSGVTDCPVQRQPTIGTGRRPWHTSASSAPETWARPSRASSPRVATPSSCSATAEIAAALPQSRVLKAFNTTFAGTLGSGEVGGQRLDVFLAGDDGDAKATVTRLVEAGGMRAVDAGPLRRARQLEHLGFLHMALQDGLGTGYGTAVKIITG